MHGKVSSIVHQAGGLFSGLPTPFIANRYHSLMVAKDGFPACLRVTAESEDGVIQALEHRELPIFGVQFHPESIATEHGHMLLQNFINIAENGGSPS